MRIAIDAPCAWKGEEIAGSDRWIRRLDGDVIAAIDDGLAQFKRLGLDWTAANLDTFELSGLDGLFDDIRDELEEGSGMMRLSGLPIERYGLDDLQMIWAALGHYIGAPVSQSLSGQRQMFIEDTGKQAAAYGELKDKQNFRSSRARALSTAALRFHTDRCDVVGLMCVRQARKGGHSQLASAVAVHNEMLRRRPDLLEVLFTDYPRSRFGEEVSDASKWYMLPVFALKDGKLSTHYSRTYIEAAQINPAVPRLSEAQNEAIDLLAELATELCFEMTLQPGDIQLLNNHVVFHARAAFEDHSEPGHGRLLVRQWLAMPNSRALPEGHEVLWGSIAPGAHRGGIWPPEERPRPL